MKNILKKFLIISFTFLIMLNITIISRAEDEIETTNLIQPRGGVTESESASSEKKRNDNLFSLTQNDVTVDESIYGDVYICSAGTVTINSIVLGNAFIVAPAIKISENAVINSSLYAAAKDITIDGTVSGNVYSASNNFTLNNNADLNLDLFSVSENIALKGLIYRNASVCGDNLTIAEDASIKGNLNYTASEKISIPEGIVGGNVNFIANSSNNEKNSDDDKISEAFFAIVSYSILTLALFAIFKLYNCKAFENQKDIFKKLPKALLYGLLGIFVTPIVCIILLSMVVTANVAGIILLVYSLIILIASSTSILLLSNYIEDKLKDKIKINDTLRAVLCIIAVCVIYKLLQHIPVIGALATLLFVLAGFGLLMQAILPQKQQDK